MAQSQNTKVDFSIKATSLNGLTNYGDVMVGDKAFEFYNEKNKEDFIQIPWEEIDYISASVYFNKKIARFAIFTKNNGHFTFSTRDNVKTLQVVGNHFPKEKCIVPLHSLPLLKGVYDTSLTLNIDTKSMIRLNCLIIFFLFHEE